MEGQVVIVQAAELLQTQCLVPDLATWVQCFSVYAAVVISTFPERAQGLMAYMTDIAKASVKYKWPSWVIYDQNYRMEAVETQKAD